MNIFLFELKKVLFSKRFLITLVLLAVLIMGLFIRNYVFLDLVIEVEEEKVITYTQEAQANLRMLKESVQANSEDTNSEEQLKHLSVALDALYEWRPLIESEDWKAELTVQNEFLSALLLYKEENGDFSLTMSEIKRMLASNEHHLATDIRPEPDDYSIALPNFMKQVTSIYVNVGAIAILLLIVGDSLTSEFEQRSIQFLYTQPLKKTSILHAKYATSITVYIVVTAMVYAIVWLLGMLFGYNGTFQYPVMLNFNEAYQFITIADYMQWSLLGTTATMVFVMALCYFISLLTKHTIVTLLTALVLLVGGFFGMQAISSDAIGWVNPFGLVFAGLEVLDVGELWIQSVPSIVLVAILLYVLALFRINRSY